MTITPQQAAAEVEAEWMEIALALDAENRELRRLMTQLLVWAWERRELHYYARTLLEQRWPQQKAA